MQNFFARLAVSTSAVMLAGSVAAPLYAQTVSADEAKKIATEAYLYAYPMLYNYKTLFQQAADPSFPGYAGGSTASVTTRAALPRLTRTSSRRATTRRIPGPGSTCGPSRWWCPFQRHQTATTSSSGSICTRKLRLHRLTGDRHRGGSLSLRRPGLEGRDTGRHHKVLRAETDIDRHPDADELVRPGGS